MKNNEHLKTIRPKFNNLKPMFIISCFIFAIITIISYILIKATFLVYLFIIEVICILLIYFSIKSAKIAYKNSLQVSKNNYNKFNKEEFNPYNEEEREMINLIKKYQIENKINTLNKSLSTQPKIVEDRKFIFKFNNNKIPIIQTLLNNFNPKKILLISELLGIILGDGHVTMDYTKSKYLCLISLNSEEKEQIYRVINLVKTIFNLEPSITHRDFDNTTLIGFYHKELIEFLIYLGITPGNKVKNQVNIPRWIKNLINQKDQSDKIVEDFYKNIIISCIKGLFDTDGSIYLRKKPENNYVTLGIKFTSGSKNLVIDFKDLVEFLDIKMSKVNQYNGLTKNGNKYTGYAVSTESKYMVKKFLFEIVKPCKWKAKRVYIEEKLKEFGLTLNNLLIYKQKSLGNKEGLGLYLKTLFEEFGTFDKVRECIIREYKTPIKKETIAMYIKKYLIQRGKDYNKWLELNAGINIDGRVIGSMRIPFKVKSYICKFVLNLLLENLLDVNDADIMDNLTYFIKKSDLRRLDFLLDEKVTRNLIINFLNSSVKLVRYIIDNVNDRKSPEKIIRSIKRKYSIDLPYHHSQITEIVNQLFE